MENHFRAFSFVDRITAVEPGVRIRGTYAIPYGLESFSNSLVSEAVGQLAAWAAMAFVNFERRPVAGIAESIELLGPVKPGQLLELAVEMESVDHEAANYHGSAHADGVPIVRLGHCVGPMVAVEEFDCREKLHERFTLLCGPGAVPGAFGGVPPLVLEPANGEAGQCARATLRVPASAPFFADHFPRRPVFPGSLLMHASMQLSAALASQLPRPARGGHWALRGVSNMKLRAFIPPGETLALEAKLDSLSDDSATISVETRMGKRMVGGARVLLGTEGRS